MTPILALLAGILCIAVAIAAAMLTHELVQNYETPFARYYFYYLAAFYGFAFYGIMARNMMQTMLQALDLDTGTVPGIITFLPVISIPFLLIACIMLVYMGDTLSGRPLPKPKFGIHILVLALVIPCLWGSYALLVKGSNLFHPDLQWIALAGIQLLDGVHTAIFLGKAIRQAPGIARSRKHPLQVFIALMAIGCITRGAILALGNWGGWAGGLPVVLYFLSNLFPLLYLRMRADLLFRPVFASSPNEDKKDQVCSHYGITHRERDIIDKICEGKTNRQIADELFISLQTVKDHTHRIYTKIGINSRMKLVRLVNG